MPRLVRILALGVLPLAGFAVVWWVTRHGVGLSRDSAVYIDTARWVASGHGFVGLDGDERLTPSAHYPPGLASLLAVGHWVGIGPLRWIRYVNAACLAGSLLVVQMLVLRYTRGDLVAAIGAGVLTLLSLGVLTSFVMLYSEPPFLLLVLLGVFMLTRSDRWQDLIMGSVAIGLAVQFRYAGVGVMIAGAVYALSGLGGGVTGRLIRGGVVWAIGTVPLMAWLLWTGLATGRFANRDSPPGGHHVDWDHLLQTLGTMLVKHDIARIHERSFAWIVLGVVVLGLVAWLASRRAGGFGGLGLVWLVVLLHPLVLVVSMQFFDWRTEPDIRQLMPLHVVGIVAVVSSAARCLRRWPVRIVGLAALGGFAIPQFDGAREWFVNADNQLGYASAAWRDDALIRWVRRLPPEARVYSNDRHAVLLLGGRHATPVPHLYERFDLTRRHRQYERKMGEIRRFIADNPRPVYAVMWDGAARRSRHLVGIGQFARDAGLVYAKVVHRRGVGMSEPGR